MKRLFLLLALLAALPVGAQTLVTGTFNAPNGLAPAAAGLKTLLTVNGTAVCGQLDFQAYANGSQLMRLIWNNVTYFPQRVRAYVRCSDGSLISSTAVVGISLIPTSDAQPAGAVYQLTGLLTGSADGTIQQQQWVEQKALPDQTSVNWSQLPVPIVTVPQFAVVYGTGAVNMDLEVPATTDSGTFQWEPKNSLSLKRLSCSTDTGTASINLDIRTEADPNSPGTKVLSFSLVCNPTTGSTTNFLNANVPGQSPIALLIVATSGSPGVVRVHAEY